MNTSTYFRDWLYTIYKPCILVYSSEKVKQLLLKQKENIISFRKKNNIKGSIDLYKKEKKLNKFKSKEFLKNKEKERIPTPLAISREIRLIKGSNFIYLIF